MHIGVFQNTNFEEKHLRKETRQAIQFSLTVFEPSNPQKQQKWILECAQNGNTQSARHQGRHVHQMIIIYTTPFIYQLTKDSTHNIIAHVYSTKQIAATSNPTHQ